MHSRCRGYQQEETGVWPTRMGTPLRGGNVVTSISNISLRLALPALISNDFVSTVSVIS